MSSFLKVLCEVCGAERGRLRLAVSDAERPVIIVDQRMPAPETPVYRHGASGSQIPLLEQSIAVGDSSAPRQAASGSAGGEAVISEGACLESDGLRELNISRRLNGFDLGLELVLRERSAGFINERLWKAVAFLDLLEAFLDGSAVTDRRVDVDCAASPAFNPPLLGEAPAMIGLKRIIGAVSQSDIPLLIEGESGTGKEVVAHNVHRMSRRHLKPLVIASSLELPHSLLQSELFGHAEGAFTGASRDRTGLIESAGGGTFFLDEIGEMPLTLQAALLRVLQEKEVRRLGESRRRKVDVRFVFATNRDLSDLVRKGRFRKDLYFRVAGMRVHIPPLRARKEDIIPLARFFLARIAKQSDFVPPPLSPDAIRSLVRYHWPGNVRELKNEMERLTALYAGDKVISAAMLSPHIADGSDGMDDPGIEGSCSLPGAIQRLERAMIREALRRYAGNRTRAAGALGITRQGLLKKLKRHGELA